MDPNPNPTSDPSILLLNEIDILLAQTRLMELYLKQAQATAANDAAQAQQLHRSELARLRAELTEKEQIAAKHAALVVDQQLLACQIAELEAQLNHKQRDLDDRGNELEAARIEVERLHGEVAQLETAGRRAHAAALEGENQCQHLQSELAGLRLEIEQYRYDFHQRQLSADELERMLRGQLSELQAQLSDTQAWSRNATGELEQARAEIAVLHDRLAEAQASRQQAEADAAAKLEQSRSRFEAEIGQLRDALAMRDETAQKNSAALAELEKTLGGEIATLRGELEQKQQQLAVRDAEWQQAANEISALRQQISDFETAQQQAAAEKAEFERRRQALENDIAELHNEIARKERELTQRFEAVSAVELALHGRIQVLQQELARSQNELVGRDSELEGARAEIAKVAGQIETLDHARAAAESAGIRVAEESRQQFEVQLSQLDAALAQKEAALRELEVADQASEERLNGEILQLRSQLDQQRNDAELGRNQLDRAQEEIAALRDRYGALELARQEAQENWQRAGFIQSELQARLKAKSDELSSVQTDLADLRQQLGDKINELQSELVQKQLLVDSRSAEIADLKAQLNETAMRFAEAEAARQQFTVSLQETEQSRVAHQQEIAALHEDYQSRLRELESELVQARDKADNASIENYQTARRADHLETDLHARDENLAAASAESAALQARVNDLTSEQASSQAQAQAIERARALLDSELAALGQALEAKTSELIQQHGLALAQKHALEDFENRLGEQQQLAAHHKRDLETAQAQAVELHQRILDLERAAGQSERTASAHLAQIKQVYDLQLEALNDALHAALAEKAAVLENSQIERANLEQSLRQEIQQSHWAAAQQQAALENLAAAHREQVQKLEAKLSEQHGGTVQRDGELEKSNAQVRALKRRVEELEVELRHAEITALSRAEQMRRETAAQIDALNAALSQSAAELAERGSSQAGAEPSLRHEIDRLVREVEDRDQILHNRNDELVRVRAELEQIQERFNLLESSTSQAERATSGEVEQMRTEFHSQLALLQAELSQKESALEEQRASANGLEQQNRDEIETLGRQLSEQKTANEQSLGESNISIANLERLVSRESTLNATATGMAQIDGEATQRHWRSRFVAKRRWKV